MRKGKRKGRGHDRRERTTDVVTESEGDGFSDTLEEHYNLFSSQQDDEKVTDEEEG